MNRTWSLLACVMGLGLMAAQAAIPDLARELSEKIARSQPGTTVTLPAGTIAFPPTDLPAGVSIQGAGYGKTILVAQGEYAFRVKGGSKCTISDLTIREAGKAGIIVEDSAGVTVSRVVLAKNLLGVLVNGSSGVQIENVVAVANRTGLVMNDTRKSAIVNCTLVRNGATALSLGRTVDCAVFNTIMVLSPIGLFDADNKGLRVDYNLYRCSYIGKGTDVPVPTLGAWRDLTGGFDAHSLNMDVKLADEAGMDFHPTTPLNWAPDRAVTAGWGTGKFAGFAAPATDLDGRKRGASVALGAFEALPLKTERPADGTFTVKTDDTLKSAALYDVNNRQVRILFSLMPLKKGKYSYWLPSRNWKGDAIVAGEYELRVVEAMITMKYLSSPGNTAVSTKLSDYASTGVQLPVFDSDGLPILCHNWSEGYLQFRAMDARLEHQRWAISGCSACYGAASDGQGTLYGMVDADAKTVSLMKIDERKGTVQPQGGGLYCTYVPKADVGSPRGLAFMDGKLYAGDEAGNRMTVSEAATIKFSKFADVPTPVAVAADPGRHLVWVLSNREKVLALGVDGTVKYTFEPKVSGAFSLAVNGNRMVVLGLGTGKLHLFDCSDPAAIKPVREIGKGDGPQGPLVPDRFLFQTDPTNRVGGAQVALNAAGEIAVVDKGVKLFRWDGTPLRQFTGIWAQYDELGANERGQPVQIIDKTEKQTFLLDEKTGTWKPEALWKTPAFTDNQFWHFFRHKGQLYGVHAFGKIRCVAVARYDNYTAVPLIAFKNGKGGTVFTDNFAAPLDQEATWKPVMGKDGKQIAGCIEGSLIPCGNGDIRLGGPRPVLLPFKGVDERGVPQYDWDAAKIVRLNVDGKQEFTSPFDYTTKENIGSFVKYVDWFSDGTMAATVSAKSNPGTGFSNWGGSDVAGFDALGGLRWYQPMPDLADVAGAKIANDLSYSIDQQKSEVEILDRDGQYVGATGAPQDLYWHGMWLDNIHQFVVFRGATTGKTYVIFGNFNDCTMWWMETVGADRITRQAIHVAIDAAKATALASLPRPAPPKRAEAIQTQVTVKKLDAAMPMDGDMAKWRKVLPQPQIVITPETGSNISGPADSSALVRLAHEGGRLYVQVIQFDNLVTMHQPMSKFYKQDAIEMSINSYVNGIKINVTKVVPEGELVFRDGWFLKGKPLDAAKAPRKITVLDNAREISERRIIEQIYGIDLQDSKVVVSEFVVPLDKETFEGREKAMPEGTSGSKLALGFMIDDNDQPGADVQRCSVWPVTYGTFAAPEASAQVTLE